MASRRLGEAGVVRLRVFVDIEGQALKVELERSSGYPRLDQSALDTVANWRFVPARRGATPEASWVVVPLNFSSS
jgi:protein TonB